MSLVSRILLQNFFKLHIYGNRALFLVLNYLFKSLPIAPVLEFPIITPSGFNMGMKIVITLHFRIIYFLRMY